MEQLIISNSKIFLTQLIRFDMYFKALDFSLSKLGFENEEYCHAHFPEINTLIFDLLGIPEENYSQAIDLYLHYLHTVSVEKLILKNVQEDLVKKILDGVLRLKK